MNNRLLIINGPGLSDLSNYNETGYDDLTLDAVQQKCSETCEGLGLEMDFRQNDNESELLSVLRINYEEKYNTNSFIAVLYINAKSFVGCR